MVAVDADRTLPGASADFEQKHVGLRSIFLVVLISGVHQKLVASKALWPMALFTGFPRRAKVLHRRRNRARISMKGDCEDLPQARKLGPDKPPRSGTDMTLDTSHARMGGVLIRRELGNHHAVAGGPAKAGRIH